MIYTADFLGYIFLTIFIAFLIGYIINGIFSIFRQTR